MRGYETLLSGLLEWEGSAVGCNNGRRGLWSGMMDSTGNKGL